VDTNNLLDNSGPGFGAVLSGGHLNSLGRTLEIVDAVLTDQALVGDLLDTYNSTDATVRLRVSKCSQTRHSSPP
jgi:predicted methyltransferase MtxX (methanogen marker protein 4)